MRRVLTVLFGDEANPVTTTGIGRAEQLRMGALTMANLLVLGGAVLPTPLGLYLLVHGVMLPFVLILIGFAVSAVSFSLQRNGATEGAATAQVVGTLLVGTLLSFANPAATDFGLGTILLAPIQAALLCRSAMRHWAWALAAVGAGLATTSSLGVAAWPEPYYREYTYLAALSFALAAFALALTAGRMSSAFEMYERAQVAAYRHLIEHVQDAVIRFSPDGRAIFTSRASEGLFGCRRFELAGNGIVERVHVLDRPIYLTTLADATRGSASRRIEIRVRRDDPSGQEPVRFVWVEVSFSPMQGEGEGRREVVAMFHDISERRGHEDELRAAHRLAEEANTAKSTFLATIGHELRTPLNAIVGFSEMMSSGVVGTLAPTHKEYADLISRSGRHLLDIVTMLLDMSRIEAGKFEVQTEPFEPESIVKPSLQMIEAVARDKGVALRAEIQPGLPLLMADERACRQILINLVSNAVKFTDAGGTVTVALRRHGAQVALVVTDTGVGMTAEAVARVGEPFFQAQEGPARRFEGTGLGLSIVKGLVELHDGALRVRSAPGQGTTMTVLLPINGPETKSVDTGSVTPLRAEPNSSAVSPWHEQKRKAQ